MRKTEPQTETSRTRKRIEADLSKQAPNNSYDPPRFYEDVEIKCRNCGKRELWSAEQQQWWYEVVKGPVQSIAVLCRACRQAKRAAHRGTPRKSHAQRRAGDSA